MQNYRFLLLKKNPNYGWKIQYLNTIPTKSARIRHAGRNDRRTACLTTPCYIVNDE